MGRSVIVSTARTPFGRLGGSLTGYEAFSWAGSSSAPPSSAPESRMPTSGMSSWARCSRAARDRRRHARRPSPRAAGRPPVGHGQQGLRLQHPRDRDRRPDDPRRRARRRRRRRDGVDDERAVRAEEGALRLPARRRDADRPDRPRRSRLVLRPPAHDPAGVLRLPRARHRARGPGPLGAALARARGQRDRQRTSSTPRSSRSTASRRTRALAATPPTRSWRSCGPFSTRTGRRRRATLPASTTARPRWW